jgi:hypothetical protein
MLAEYLVAKYSQEVEQQEQQIALDKSVCQLQKITAKKEFSQLIARPDTLALLVLGGLVKGGLGNSTDSKKVAVSSFFSRFVRPSSFGL